VIFIGLLGGLGSIGNPADPLTSLSSVLYTLIRAGAPALAYLAAAAGLGRLASPLVRGSSQAAALQVATGLALLLSLSHLLGVFGVLTQPVALGVVIIGIVLLAHQLAGLRDQSRPTLAPAWLLALPGVALLLVAACNPPGWLWDSEAGGYDALSYHLQLPQEWLAAGRIWPNTHNVFSFQPAYVESAFVHLGAMIGAPAQSGAGGSRSWGLLAGEGLGVISCQLLSAGITILAAWFTAAAACIAGRRAGIALPAALAGVLMLSTPWTIVAGSLAYNDMAMVALIAGAVSAALDEPLSPARRGVLAGLLIGVACGCKPTALPLGAPLAGLALVATTRVRRWLPMIGSGALAGLIALAPWLIRNALAGGNPVFPEAAGIFGSAHWSPDQLHRYHAAVSFNGSVLDRLKLMFFQDPTDPAGPRHRGLLHPQWFAFFPLTSAAAIVAILRRPTRTLGYLLGGVELIQLLAWLFATHLQSRFLLPLAIPACVLLPLAVGSRRTGIILACAACLIQAGAAIVIFAGQRGGAPNQLLVAGPSIRTGESFRRELEAMDPAARRAPLADLPQEPYVNLAMPADGALYLVGDATPLYYAVPTVYNTTWDSWPLADAMAASPDNPGAWSAALISRGIRYALVNFAEMDRLTRSGWADPRITPKALNDWLAKATRPVRQWPHAVLVQLEAPR
jgi:hypothetical protein